ncbi:unnamed protein product [Chilo suppressalis]|uniref:Band 7 domain-containing protein n=1 Tax=Chilo suppressalis TaxID=168631 RepID=A0ABN8BCU5_CHISP|nr:unnamed protein product [Chilo suppressalis]
MEHRESDIILSDFTNESKKEKVFRFIMIILIIMCPIILVFCFLVVKQYKRAVIFRFGRVRKDSPAGPGVIWIVPCIDKIVYIDLRTQSFNLPEQEILTKDSVTVIVNAVVYCHVQKPLLCILNVDYYLNATELTAVSILRNIMGQYTLTELLSNRINISRTARAEIDNVTNEWGVTTERIEIKDVILPCELQKAMAAEAEGTRIAKAKIIEAQGEIKAAENLRDASRIMVDNPQIMLLRYLQTLNYIASQQQTSIIFPFPLDLPEPPKSRTSVAFYSKSSSFVVLSYKGVGGGRRVLHGYARVALRSGRGAVRWALGRVFSSQARAIRTSAASP